jgi:hypothetical protein
MLQLHFASRMQEGGDSREIAGEPASDGDHIVLHKEVRADRGPAQLIGPRRFQLHGRAEEITRLRGRAGARQR